MAATKHKINFLGDVMLGRLVDQCFASHVHEPEEAGIARSFINQFPHLRNYNPCTPWGDTMSLLHSSDLNLINLETSATTSETKWPNKMFNYRMHPNNIEALKQAHIHYATLANNHTLDFSEVGLQETVKTVRDAGIAFAGAGASHREAIAPARIQCGQLSDERIPCNVHVWAGSDHPAEWKHIPEFHTIAYTDNTRQRLRHIICSDADASQSVLKVFSVHWGPNYAWQPSADIRSLGHFLIDECGIDVIHGHSSHHIQGVELYKGKVIMYGCGDFVDDYALVADYRNDLSGVWRLNFSWDGQKHMLGKLELFPTRIKHFQAQRLSRNDGDHYWIKAKFSELCNQLGTRVEEELGTDGQIIINISS